MNQAEVETRSRPHVEAVREIERLVVNDPHYKRILPLTIPSDRAGQLRELKRIILERSRQRE